MQSWLSFCIFFSNAIPWKRSNYAKEQHWVVLKDISALQNIHMNGDVIYDIGTV